MTVSIDQQVLADFAKDPIDHSYDALSKWTSGKLHEGFQIYETSVGGAPGHHYQTDVSPSTFTFKPMTVSDFKRLRPEMAKGLDDYADPGGLGWNDHVGAFGDGISSEVGGTFEEDGYKDPWYTYYYAKDNDGEEKHYGGTPSSPWAEELSDDWITSVGNRLKEVDDLRAEFKNLIVVLNSAAEDYAGTDLDNAINISKYGIDE